jgi:hypothetical protein
MYRMPRCLSGRFVAAAARLQLTSPFGAAPILTMRPGQKSDYARYVNGLGDFAWRTGWSSTPI